MRDGIAASYPLSVPSRRYEVLTKIANPDEKLV